MSKHTSSYKKRKYIKLNREQNDYYSFSDFLSYIENPDTYLFIYSIKILTKNYRNSDKCRTRWNKIKKKTSIKKGGCNSKLKQAKDPMYECNEKTGRWNKKKNLKSNKKQKISKTSIKKTGCNDKLKKAKDPMYECNEKTGRWNKKKL